MEMEFVVTVPPQDFNFDSNCSSPYMTAPSSPQRFGNFYFSAPTSPTRASAFFQELNHWSSRHSSASSVPFNWEQKPGIPKSKPTNNFKEEDFDHEENEDFEFNFSGQLDRASLTAEELFDGGKIRPLKPPPRLQSGDGLSPPASNVSSPRSRISQGKKIVQEALSPRHHKTDCDPFAVAIEETRKREGSKKQQSSQEHEQKRGRERVSSSSTSLHRKGTRSLSPLRVSDIMGDFEGISQTVNKPISSTTSNANPPTPTSSSSFLSSISFTKGYRKWRLKDFLLFRSASEGRATDKDPLRKFAVLSKKSSSAEEDVKNSSFRSTESSGSISRRRGPVSAHEYHYTVNRAVSEELKKKTFLPYRRGLLGCLGFNSGVHEIARSIGSMTRG
ncbi:AR781, pheromone receptor-like protein [Quillaja saponaria]|uniref:AR781, pheromone receptor-like protein n=1 Tax=Quillaja saponaria TaxID=32244 RepID=A0AAD7M028_QUISA|nr:AR781, pheromone receptor-like protein [Quillaja saponaria]